MLKPTLDLDQLEVVSFETEPAYEGDEIAAISGQACVTWRTIYGTCCTP